MSIWRYSVEISKSPWPGRLNNVAFVCSVVGLFALGTAKTISVRGFRGTITSSAPSAVFGRDTTIFSHSVTPIVSSFY